MLDGPQLSRNRRWVLCNSDTADGKRLWFTYMCKIGMDYDSAVVLNHLYVMQWCLIKLIFFKQISQFSEIDVHKFLLYIQNYDDMYDWAQR